MISNDSEPSTAAHSLVVPRQRDGAKQTPAFLNHPLEHATMERQHQLIETDRPDADRGAPTYDIISQFQHTMLQWLELQRDYQSSSQRFLETQESIFLACLQGEPVRLSQPSPRPMVSRQRSALASTPTQPPAAPRAIASPRARATQPAPSIAPVAARPAPVQAIVPAPPVSAPPAAASPAPVAVAATTVAAPAPAAKASLAVAPAPPVVKAAPTPVATATAAEPAKKAPPPQVAAPAATDPAAASSIGAPSVEVFREDLLRAISERTGYPTDMLDEKLELEAGLGIDSIKTIEVFSQLSQYHMYLPGASEDQEESLAAFAKLRTIGDILAAYSENIKSKQPHEGNKEAVPQPAVSVPEAGAIVERVSIEAVPAAVSADGDEERTVPA
jgi:hypothetical protein